MRSTRLTLPALALATLALAASATIAIAGQTALSPEGDFSDLDVNVLPPTVSEPGHPRGGAIDFHSFAGNRKDPAEPFNGTDLKISLARGFAINGASFPTCPINQGGFSQCASKSQIGTGSAEGAIPDGSGGVTYFPVSLTGYNGAKIGGKPSIVFLGQAGGATVAEIDFTISETPRGEVLDDFVPAGSQDQSISITQFNFRTSDVTAKGRNGKPALHYVTNPEVCPKQGWKFALSDTNANGTLTSTSFAPCTDG